MLNAPYRCFQDAMRGLLHLVICYALLAGVGYGQAMQVQPDKPARGEGDATIAEEIAKVKSGKYDLVSVERIAEAKAVEAIPILEEQFMRRQDPLDKAKIAEALVKLGDKDDTYWNYLVQVVTPAVESNAPDFMTYDAEGNLGPGPSPAFLAWAKTHNVSPESAGEEQVYWLPGKVALLGGTGDRRAIPLLRRALLSPNHMIEVMAALGLAELQDEGSIPHIIAACQRAPAEAASAIAEGLVYFDDQPAQAAVDTYVPRERAKALRDKKARGGTPFH
jgi:hypothetical protein